ncbi:MAG: substrate-binding domain-containing protein [Hyphomicrobiales bacterium]
MAFVAPQPGDDYYNTCRQGVLEVAAAEEGAQVTYTAPASRDAAKQAEVITALADQKYDAILLTPDEGPAVLEACGAAVRAGVKVISIGQALPPDLRHLHVATPEPMDFAAQLLSLMSTALNKKGELALMGVNGGDPDTAAVAKALQKEMLKPDYVDLPLITTGFAGTSGQEAYEQAILLAQTYPTLTGLIAFTREATLGSARAITDLGKASRIKVVGVGLPSHMVAAVKSGVCPAFVTWNPVDVGFAAAKAAAGLVRQSLVIAPGVPLDLGRLGQVPVLDGRIIRLGGITPVDANSIDSLAEEY